jgi:hypothetical protein
MRLKKSIKRYIRLFKVPFVKIQTRPKKFRPPIDFLPICKILSTCFIKYVLIGIKLLKLQENLSNKYLRNNLNIYEIYNNL